MRLLYFHSKNQNRPLKGTGAKIMFTPVRGGVSAYIQGQMGTAVVVLFHFQEFHMYFQPLGKNTAVDFLLL